MVLSVPSPVTSEAWILCRADTEKESVGVPCVLTLFLHHALTFLTCHFLFSVLSFGNADVKEAHCHLFQSYLTSNVNMSVGKPQPLKVLCTPKQICAPLLSSQLIQPVHQLTPSSPLKSFRSFCHRALQLATTCPVHIKTCPHSILSAFSSHHLHQV